MMSFFAPYKLWFEIIIIGALLSGMAFGVHEFLEHERDIGRKEVQALWDAQKVTDKLASDKQEKEWREKYDNAVNQGVKNVEIARASAATANAAADSLRNTTNAIGKLLPTASAETARLYATTYAAVFAECVGEYKEMAGKAQGHANDAQSLSDGWPVNPPDKKP